jgi:3-methyladenine DNA glycosylase AlkD
MLTCSKYNDIGQKFFKEKIKVYGIKTAIVGKISKNYFNELKDSDKEEATSCVELIDPINFMRSSSG